MFFVFLFFSVVGIYVVLSIIRSSKVIFHQVFFFCYKLPSSTGQQKFYILRLESCLYTPEADHHESSLQASFHFSGSLTEDILLLLPTLPTVLLCLLLPHLDICSFKNFSDRDIFQTFWGSLNGLTFPKFSVYIPNTVITDGPASICILSRSVCCLFSLKFYVSVIFFLSPLRVSPKSLWLWPNFDLLYCGEHHMTVQDCWETNNKLKIKALHILTI